ncbi:hypothetical protein Mic7113_1003 [Allocoleopsis franciscana PCC 7113]|uniref:Uncharacterized protein n=1 Tax=Allocoleopsis franciscana PCC 7113 TaxID=1173027 RepID=K9W9H7_9CYAN|nr:hypothetical protein Mic7113_1003 [Allocoleopsis franciscana PCC 7113]
MSKADFSSLKDETHTQQALQQIEWAYLPAKRVKTSFKT